LHTYFDKSADKLDVLQTRDAGGHAQRHGWPVLKPEQRALAGATSCW
jgi:hypothetical protein